MPQLARIVMYGVAFAVSGLAQSSPAPLIDRELFFGDPEISGAQLSPDGKFIAFMKPWNDTRNIWVKTTDQPFSAAKRITAETKRPIPAYFWSWTANTCCTSRTKMATRTTIFGPSIFFRARGWRGNARSPEPYEPQRCPRFHIQPARKRPGPPLRRPQ